MITVHPAFALGLVLAFGAPMSAQDLHVKSGEKIAFLGDSITQGGARQKMGYCRLVIDGLKQAGVETEMIPAGISGHKSNQMLARLQRDVIDKKPDWMTLSCGVNDVWHGARGVKLPEYERNIREIVDRAQAAGIKVMILTATMIHENPKSGENVRLAPYNAFLRELAAEKKCLIADLYERMLREVSSVPGKKGNLLTTDGVHMNTLGNIMMATGVLEGFGMSSDQLAAARKKWMSQPNTCRIRIDVNMNGNEFRRLQELAVKEGINVRDLFTPGVEAKKAELLKK